MLPRDTNNTVNRKSKLATVVILRVVGISGLFAIPAIFFPYEWMNGIHDYMGLGELPATPIVMYLARSLSTFYAVFSALTLFISFDIPRYRLLVKLWALTVVAIGLLLLGIDLTAGMPLSWTLCEGPPTIVVGMVVFWLQRKRTDAF